MKRIKTIRDLKRLGIRGEVLVFAHKFPSAAEFWDACERADWLLCVLVQGRLLGKAKALKLASAFAKRTPTRICQLGLARVKKSRSGSDAASDAWAASYASAHAVVYAHCKDFDASVFASEMRWQAKNGKQIVRSPFCRPARLNDS